MLPPYGCCTSGWLNATLLDQPAKPGPDGTGSMCVEASPTSVDDAYPTPPSRFSPGFAGGGSTLSSRVEDTMDCDLARWRAGPRLLRPFLPDVDRPWEERRDRNEGANGSTPSPRAEISDTVRGVPCLSPLVSSWDLQKGQPIVVIKELLIDLKRTARPGPRYSQRGASARSADGNCQDGAIACSSRCSARKRICTSWSRAA